MDEQKKQLTPLEVKQKIKEEASKMTELVKKSQGKSLIDNIIHLSVLEKTSRTILSDILNRAEREDLYQLRMFIEQNYNIQSDIVIIEGNSKNFEKDYSDGR